MNKYCAIQKNHVHIWHATVTDCIIDQTHFYGLLSEDEKERANRFRFDVHRKRFIIARGLLRTLLSSYTHLAPQTIHFSYGSHGKPYLQHTLKPIQFNVSHSDEIIVYAFSLTKAVGIDIEKIKPSFNKKIAKRFFNPTTYTELMSLPEEDQCLLFHRLWSEKEALTKALGERLLEPLHMKESTSLYHHEKHGVYSIKNFFVHPGYEASIAKESPIKKIILRQWEPAIKKD